MDIRTFRAQSMQDALAQVRDELGPHASVLHTRELRRGPIQWLTGSPRIEVTASATLTVPSRFAALKQTQKTESPTIAAPARPRVMPMVEEALREDPARIPAADIEDFRERLRRRLKNGGEVGQSLVEDMSQPTANATPSDALFTLFTELIDNELPEEVARELVERVRQQACGGRSDPESLKQRAAEMLETEIRTSGAIRLQPGHCRRVALVGPTGVGKTTTIAKLAANFHLREKRQVGLITVDTYRIAAVEQLRTYADIIDLPMEVVSTPREMRSAVERLSEMDLVLMDTAGRSPRDEVKIRELKSFIAEAQADEVHLVLSSTSSAASLKKTIDQFAQACVTSLLITKLDEASGLGGLAPLARNGALPISYLTNGQNVPDDIAPADAGVLTRLMLGLEK